MALQTMIMVHSNSDGRNYFTGRPLSVLPRVGELITIDKDRPLRILRIEHSILTKQDQHIITVYVEPI